MIKGASVHQSLKLDIQISTAQIDPFPTGSGARQPSLRSPHGDAGSLRPTGFAPARLRLLPDAAHACLRPHSLPGRLTIHVPTSSPHQPPHRAFFALG
jgi:hypothetical protein